MGNDTVTENVKIDATQKWNRLSSFLCLERVSHVFAVKTENKVNCFLTIKWIASQSHSFDNWVDLNDDDETHIR